MRKLHHILVVTFAILIGIPCTTIAQDTTFNQVVTVERDYQPEIEDATIIPIKPSILEVQVDPNPVIYSTYSTPLSIGINLHPLQAAKLRFTPPTPTTGRLNAAVGHHNTYLDFNYQLREINNLTANVYALHDAYWGSNTLAHTKLGGNGEYHIKKSKLYFGIEGETQQARFDRYFDRTSCNCSNEYVKSVPVEYYSGMYVKRCSPSW